MTHQPKHITVQQARKLHELGVTVPATRTYLQLGDAPPIGPALCSEELLSEILYGAQEVGQPLHRWPAYDLGELWAMMPRVLYTKQSPFLLFLGVSAAGYISLNGPRLIQANDTEAVYALADLLILAIEGGWVKVEEVNEIRG